VVLADGADVSEHALRDHCRASLARYKVPDAIARVAALPRNAMAKVIKRDLRHLFAGD
jgi:acyl-coenzyme A synthetase/AMP-(fatty) acid ligase